MWNAHMFIEYSHAYNVHTHRNPKNTRNTDDSLGSGTKLLLPSLSLGFRHEESETQFFYADCSSIVCSQLTDPTNARACPAVYNWTGLAQVRKINSFVKVQISTHCFYSKSLRIPAHRFRAWSHSHPSSVLFPIWGFYCDICDCHILPARAWTPAWMSAPTHALSQKVLSLTKPKDKIYKTKNDNIKKNPSAIIQQDASVFSFHLSFFQTFCLSQNSQIIQ